MPTPDSGQPDALGGVILAIALLVFVGAAVVLLVSSPSVRDRLSRLLVGHEPPTITDDAPKQDGSGTDATQTGRRRQGAQPFPGFDANIYGALPPTPDDSG